MTAPLPRPTRADERRHAHGDDPWWCESWDFDFATTDAVLGGYVRLDLLPNQRVCWYATALVGQHRDLVAVVDHEVDLPRPPGLEIRGEGLWADHIVEDPLDHVSVGCEAFALRLDDATDALAVPLLGDRTPFGLDLGWETEGPVTPIAGGYALPCRVVGEVLVADERIELDAFGWRRHTWDTAADHGRSTDGTSRRRELPGADVGGRSGRSSRGRLADGTWLYDGDRSEQWYTDCRLDPVAEAPLLVPAPTGGVPSRLARTLCRVTRRGRGVGGPIGAAWSDVRSQR